MCRTEVYGQATYLRAWLEERDAAYVLATRVNDMVTTLDGAQRQADELIAELPAHAWRRLSAGAGAHGPRDYDWAWIPDLHPLAGRARTLTARPTQVQRPEQVRLLPLLRTPSHASASPGLDRRITRGGGALDHAGEGEVGGAVQHVEYRIDQVGHLARVRGSGADEDLEADQAVRLLGIVGRGW